MIAEDVYRTRLLAAVDRLRSWAAAHADCAEILDEESRDYWRLLIRPHVASACPIEIVVHRDQRFDAQIGDEVYESRPVERFDHFAPLFEAVAGGKVITRTWATAGTGSLHSVETIIDIGDSEIRDERINAAVANFAGRDACVAIDRHWLPYRR